MESLCPIVRFRLELVFLVGIVTSSICACSWLPHAPSRSIPTSRPELALEIVDMPEVICIGSQATFVVKTTPGNECLGAVGFKDVHDRWIGEDFEPMVAGDDGLCGWTWQVPDDALPGAGEFRAGVRGYGDLESLIPQTFRIEICSN